MIDGDWLGAEVRPAESVRCDMYSWRVDKDTQLIIVRTDGGPEWVPNTKTLGGLVDSVWEKWGDLIHPIAQKHGLAPAGIACQVCQESAGNQYAFRQEPNGWTGIGLLQITHPSLKGGRTDVELYSPTLNLEIGAAYTARLARQYHTDDGLPNWPCVFAAFNAGSCRPSTENQWNLHCAHGHVDAEVAFFNHLRLRELDEARLMALDIVEHQFDLSRAILDFTPHRGSDAG